MHWLITVYPRVCGEPLSARQWELGGEGLSPRVRGTPFERRPGPDFARSIPACAGNPLCHAFQSAGYEVYPRVCGEPEYKTERGCRKAGLSPRVRGPRRTGAEPVRLNGLSPRVRGTLPRIP